MRPYAFSLSSGEPSSTYRAGGVISKTVLPMPENGISGRATPVLKRSGPLVEGSGGEKTSKELVSRLLSLPPFVFEGTRDNLCSKSRSVSDVFFKGAWRSSACCLAY
jgi:hypothetical protein